LDDQRAVGCRSAALLLGARSGSAPLKPPLSMQRSTAGPSTSSTPFS
jgi:hypothetical protein